MSKYGLRSWSGPFDWLVTSNFEWIVHYLENDFKDFLQKENLECIDGYTEKFRDRENGFLFFHDEEYPFETKFDELKLKYQKRIDRFMEEIKKPCCFIRLVADVYEIKYISENFDYINRIIKRKNEQNEIIFLIRDTIEFSEDILFKHYRVSIKHSGKRAPSHEELRKAFDTAHEFLEYCALNYSSSSMMKNIIFDQQKEDIFNDKKETVFRQDQVRYRILMKLVEYDFSKIQVSEEIIIYGAGNIGKYLYQRIKVKCKVRCFIDQNKRGMIDGIPIYRLENVDYDRNTYIIVTPTYDFMNIYQKIIAQYDKAVVISLEDLLEM
ncbi:MAG: papain-like cysteine peptidase [Ruminococcus flavefaciens]|nr:papain-like cysteine peptidase [Ruminococcus flavefaciens]